MLIKAAKGRFYRLENNMLDKRIQQVCVVSLKDDLDRRKHVAIHFAELGISHYEFVDGVRHNSQAVKQFYLSKRVKAFPNCFRCGLPSCECPNNILIPQQVANCLAFKKTWVKAANHNGLTLICEDDVLFYPGAMKLLSSGLNDIELNTQQPLLLRLAHSGLEADVSLEGLERVSITQEVVMSNVAFILNQAMARLLLDNFALIETTSDIFIHNWCARLEGVNAHTFNPLIATDLSFNKQHARFTSHIHPKGINENDEIRMQAHIKRVSSKQAYDSMVEKWLQR